jgi:hypothetical protein
MKRFLISLLAVFLLAVPVFALEEDDKHPEDRKPDKDGLIPGIALIDRRGNIGSTEGETGYSIDTRQPGNYAVTGYAATQTDTAYTGDIYFNLNFYRREAPRVLPYRQGPPRIGLAPARDPNVVHHDVEVEGGLPLIWYLLEADYPEIREARLAAQAQRQERRQERCQARRQARLDAQAQQQGLPLAPPIAAGPLVVAPQAPAQQQANQPVVPPPQLVAPQPAQPAVIQAVNLAGMPNQIGPWLEALGLGAGAVGAGAAVGYGLYIYADQQCSVA